MTDIAIKLPLPLSVSGTLMNLVGAAWPDAQIVDNQDGILTGGKHVVFRIPDAPAKPVDADAVAQAVVEPGEDDLDLLELGPNGVSMTRPKHLSAAMLQIMLNAFAEHIDAVNYLENKVHDPSEGKVYVMIFARSEGQTPHELRMAAEEKLETARADVHRDVTQALLTLQGRAADAEGTYADGVRAALDAVRQLNFAHIN